MDMEMQAYRSKIQRLSKSTLQKIMDMITLCKTDKEAYKITHLVVETKTEAELLAKLTEIEDSL